MELKIGRDVTEEKIRVTADWSYFVSGGLHDRSTRVGTSSEGKKVLFIRSPGTILPVFEIEDDRDLAIIDLNPTMPVSVGYLKKDAKQARYYDAFCVRGSLADMLHDKGCSFTLVEVEKIRDWIKKFLTHNGAYRAHQFIYIAPYEVGRVIMKISRMGRKGYEIIENLEPTYTVQELEKILDAAAKIL